MSNKLIPQEEYNGCSVACVASLLGISYKKTIKLFGKNYNSKRGSYCDQIIVTLKKAGLNYKYSKVNEKTKKYVNRVGSIVFIKRSKKYPVGHYLLKTKKGWMNSWFNFRKFPAIEPVKAKFQKKLPGKAEWVIYKNNNL